MAEETEQMTLAEFIETHGITMVCDRLTRRPDVKTTKEEQSYQSYWCLTLFRGGNNTGKGPQVGECTVLFSKGIGDWKQTFKRPHPPAPTAAEVLDCLASDAGSYLNAGGFEAWASELGYDTDSRKAEAIYRACGETAGKLLDLLGHNLRHALLHTCERL